jgi:GT2 family glycosyltransferase
LVSADRAEMLRKRHPDIPVTELPDLENPERVAKAILSAAAEVLANPRAIDPLPPGDWPSVEVLIVAYNCKRIVRPVLESIAAQDYPNLRCTLVDNSSSDGTGAFVRESFPFVNVVTCSENLGFAGGNNVVLEHSDAKYVVLLNQDAVARPDFVRELVRAAERDETIAAVGGKILMLRCPTIFNSTGILVNEGGFAVDRQIGEKDEDPSPVPENVFGACGGAQLVRSSVIRRIGGFDESFFMYYEDVDLCWRMRLAGLRVLYAPLAVVLHDWFGDLDDDSEVKSASEVDAKTRRRTYLCERNRLQCVLKNLQLGHLVRVLKRLWKYDKGRLELIRKEIAGCYDTDSAGITGRAIRSAWTWNLRHAFSIFLRRRRVQKWRVVSDEAMREFVAEGVVELSDRCDLHVLHDRHCAKASPRLVVGINDQKALGPGWYAREPVADQKWDLRWSNGRAWLYVEAVREAHTLKIRLARGPFETKLRVILGRQDLGSRPIEQEGMHVIAFTLPRPQPVQKQIEVRLESNTFQLSKLHDGADHRVLGVQVAELWLE